MKPRTRRGAHRAPRNRAAGVVVGALAGLIVGFTWLGLSSSAGNTTTVTGGHLLHAHLAVPFYDTVVASWNLCNHDCEVQYHGLPAMGTVRERADGYRRAIEQSGASLVALQETNFKDAGVVTVALGRHWRHSDTGRVLGKAMMNQEVIWDSRVWSDMAEDGTWLPSGKFENATDDQAWDPTWVNPDGTRGQMLRKRWTGYQFLRLKPTGQVFAIVDVHTFWSDYLPNGAAHPIDWYRAIQVQNIANYLNSRVDNQTPRIVLGDLNTPLHTSGDTPLSTLAGLGLRNVWDVGHIAEPGRGTARWGENPNGWGRPIDHIFVPGSVKVGDVEVIKAPKVSDHHMVAAHLTFSPSGGDQNP